MRCETCRLVFRWPMQTLEESDSYYQDEYAPQYPQVQLPSDAELQNMTRSSFAGTALDISSTKIKVLKVTAPGRPVALILGARGDMARGSLAKGGYAIGFEISRPRAAYAKNKLGVRIIDRFDELQSLPAASFDVVFTNHVVEHLPNVRDVFDLMGKLLTPGGIAFHVLPNFLGKTALSGQWIMWIGEEHPLAPNMEFFRASLPRHGFADVRFGSSPFDEELIAALTGSNADAHTDGDELLVLARRNGAVLRISYSRGRTDWSMKTQQTPSRLSLWGKLLLFPGLDLHTRCRYRFLPRFFRDGPVDTLDAGCGNGAMSYAAYGRGNRVLGVTMEAGQVSKAREFFSFRGTDPARLEFEVCNLYDLPRLNRQFDQIICLETLEHIVKDEVVVKTFYSLLREKRSAAPMLSLFGTSR